MFNAITSNMFSTYVRKFAPEDQVVSLTLIPY